MTTIEEKTIEYKKKAKTRNKPLQRETRQGFQRDNSLL